MKHLKAIVVLGVVSLLAGVSFRFAAAQGPGPGQSETVAKPKKKDVPKASVTKFEKLIKTKSKKQFSPAKELADKQTDDLLKLVKKRFSPDFDHCVKISVRNSNTTTYSSRICFHMTSRSRCTFIWRFQNSIL